MYLFVQIHLKEKAIPVTGRGGLLGCEMSSLPHFLDNWLTDGGVFVGLIRSIDCAL
jgi:hypothetical protein